MEESTLLSRSFADQGLKIRIRKELRQRRKTTGKRMDSDNEDDDESPQQARNLDKRPRQTTDSIVPSSIPSLNNLTTAPLMPIPSSTAIDLRVPPSPQNMYGIQTSYRYANRKKRKMYCTDTLLCISTLGNDRLRTFIQTMWTCTGLVPDLINSNSSNSSNSKNLGNRVILNNILRHLQTNTT
jgi:hypothetical protein